MRITDRRAILRLLAALVAASAPTGLEAQDADDLAAYSALVLTTSAGLPPAILPDVLTGRPGPHLVLRGGRIAPWGADDDEYTNLAAMLALPVGARSAVGVSAGALRSDCGGCDPQLMLGLDATHRLLAYPLGGGAALAIGVHGDAGWTRLDTGIGELTALSASLGVPLALTGGSRLRGSLLLVPALGYGRLSADDIDDASGGTRPLLGGSLGVGAGAVTASVGFQRVFVERARTLVGAAVALRVRPGQS